MKKLRLPHKLTSKLSKKALLITAVLVVVIIAGGIPLALHANHNHVKAQALTAAHAKNAALAKQHQLAQSNPAQQAANYKATHAAAQKAASASSLQAKKISQATTTTNQAAAAHMITATQQKLILAKLSEIETFEKSLTAMPLNQQNKAIITEQLALQTWATQNHIPDHYVDVIID